MHFFANFVWGKQNPFNSTATGRLGFQVSGFLNTGIEQQHQYLSYKLLNTSVTLFLHIELRDSHSIPITPRTVMPILCSALMRKKEKKIRKKRKKKR